MTSTLRLFAVTLACGIILTFLRAQTPAHPPSATTQGFGVEVASLDALADAPEPQNSSSSSQPAQDRGTKAQSSQNGIPRSKQQPKRILGLMPNYRAVSAGAIPPLPTTKQAFIIATRNSFDYSSFVFVGISSLIAEGGDAHKQLGKGVPGYWTYYWRGYLDKTDGNYWVSFALPTVMHEDERYYARGEGGIIKHALYSTSRVLIAPDCNHHDTINGAELLGRGISQGISIPYYPSSDHTAGALAQNRDTPSGATQPPTPSVSSGQISQCMYCVAILDSSIEVSPHDRTNAGEPTLYPKPNHSRVNLARMNVFD